MSETDFLLPLFAGLFVTAQILYFLSFCLDFYLFSLPVNWVDMDEVRYLGKDDYPYIVLFYPVLDELETTMRTTFTSMAELDYPSDRYRVVAIPNSDDFDTIASLRRLQVEFPFVEIIEVPPTSDSSWHPVWDAWSRTPKAYWWHQGRRAHETYLPPKKTRQLVYAFYRIAHEWADREDWLFNCIDADSCPPRDHFLAAAVGIRHYDVLQATNIGGNLNASLAASWFACDHMAWDGKKYPHLSANGRHPYWMLGKGLFFKASDLVELGGFNPWMAIEDPEVGMRFWINGKRLGIINNPLIEEVPLTLARGILQRKRWACGFFQSLAEPLHYLGFTWRQRLQAWLNFLPCLSLWINAIGIPTGIWALWTYLNGTGILPVWTIGLAVLNIAAFVISLSSLYWSIWKRTALVLDRRGDRLWYMLRVNPISLMIWWTIWIVPLWLGFWMYFRDRDWAWDRTVKIDANALLIRLQLEKSGLAPHERKALHSEPKRAGRNVDG